jgi:hypothetical protein
LKAFEIFLITVLFVCVLACSKDRGPTVPPQSKPQTVFSDPQAAAEHGLITLKQMVTQNNYQEFGFTSEGDVEKASLGPPAKLFVIPNEKLANFKKGADVYPLLQDVHRLIYPVQVDGLGRTAITVMQTEQGWKLADFGQDTLAKNLADIRTTKIGQSGSGVGAAPEEYYDIRVQTMGIDFLAVNKANRGPGAKNEILLTPLTDLPPSIHDAMVVGKVGMYLKRNPSFNPRDKGSRNASDVFDALAPAAKEIEKTTGPS